MILWLAAACVQKPPPVLRPQPPDAAGPAVALAPVRAKGTWVGTLQGPQGAVPVVVQVADELAPVLLLGETRFAGKGQRAGNQVRWQFGAVGVVLRGLLVDGRFRGSFEQGGRSVPLELERMKGRLRASKAASQ